MSKHNITVGKDGENKAVDYLTKKGYIIINRNYRTPFGEIDIIAKEGDVYVFAEVKTRSTARYGKGREAITPKKREHMLKSAQFYLDENGAWDAPARIDVIELTLNEGSVVHFENAL